MTTLNQLKRNAVFFALSALISFPTFSESDKTSWEKEAFIYTVFIENQGQFDNKNFQPNSKILFGADSRGAQIYFTSKGLTYVMEETTLPEGKMKEFMEEEAREHVLKEKGLYKGTKTDMEKMNELMVTERAVLNMEWIGCNPNAQIQPSEKDNEYFNYNMDNTLENFLYKVPAFKTICYKNLYPGIDVEYRFHEKEGIKYQLIVHPGADPSVVKMKYTGADGTTMDQDGNIHFKTIFGDVIDHAPYTFYTESEAAINSSFNLEGNFISFKLDNYDSNEEIIIDPWTVNPNFASLNKALEVEADAAGNAYIYGSTATFKLRKYNSLGAFQWTFNTPWSNGNWFGELETDPAGNSYVSPGTTNLNKVDNTGALVFGTGGFLENFAMEFDNAGNLVGTGAVGSARAYNINTTTGAATGATTVSVGASSEIRSMTYAPDGNYYALSSKGFSGGNPPGKIMGFTTAFTPLWTVNSCHTGGNATTYWAPLYGIGTGASGYQGIAATCTHIYTYDGSLLCKSDINSGASVGSVVVPGGVEGQCGGILVDSCNNVYVGTMQSVAKYDENLNFITSAVSTNNVYDIHFGPNLTLYATGNGFLQQIDGLVQQCIILDSLDIYSTVDDLLCNSPSSICIDSVLGGVAPYTYTWSTSATTNCITNLAAGTYTVTITDNSCQPKSDTLSFTIVGSSNISSNWTGDSTTCNGYTDGSATVNPSGGFSPYTYLWDANAGNQTTQTANNIGAGTYYVSITDSTGCTYVDTITIGEPDAITVQVSLDDTICQTETIQLTATAQGGDGNYVWDWNSGQFNTNIINVSPTSTTSYTISVTDGNNCPGATATVNVFVRDPMTLSAFRDTTICMGDSTMIWADAIGGDGNYTFTWSDGIGVDNNVWVSPTQTTTYYVSVDDGCDTPNEVDSVTVVVGNLANPTFIAENEIGCSPLTVTFMLDSIINGYTYAWDFGDGDGATSFSQTVNHTYNLTGTDKECYDIGLTVTTNLGCITEVNFDCMVTVFPNPIADFTMDPIRATSLDPIIEFYDMSAGANQWEYWLGDGTTINDARNFYHTYVDSGEYEVTQIVHNQYGCTDTITKTVYVDYVSTIYFPNAFSPEQQDGINDGFAPVFEGISQEDYDFTIFDRWGVVLFTTTDTQKKWDGNHYKTGNPVPQGVYVYKVDYKQFDGLKNTVRGHVTLIR